MRLIDADDFKEKIKGVCDAGGWLEPVTTAIKEYICKQVDYQTTADAVEVVQCKDCKYRPTSYGDEHDLCFPEEYRCPCQCDDNWYSWMPKDDFFCARGERRDDHDAHNPKGIHA